MIYEKQGSIISCYNPFSINFCICRKFPECRAGVEGLYPERGGLLGPVPSQEGGQYGERRGDQSINNPSHNSQ